MMTYLPSILAAVVALATVFLGPMQAWVAAHPAITAVLAGVSAIIAHFLPSPRA